MKFLPLCLVALVALWCNQIHTEATNSNSNSNQQQQQQQQQQQRMRRHQQEELLLAARSGEEANGGGGAGGERPPEQFKIQTAIKLAENVAAPIAEENLIDRVKSIIRQLIVDSAASEAKRNRQMRMANGITDSTLVGMKQQRADLQFEQQREQEQGQEQVQQQKFPASSGHKMIRDMQQVYMRLPPRFGKRTSGSASEHFHHSGCQTTSSRPIPLFAD